jgi:hypothetical protein
MNNNRPSGLRAWQDYLPLILFLLIGFLVFVQSYATFVVPYYPRFWDQSIQISDIYRAYYQLSHASTPETGFFAATSTILSFKGFLFGVVATTLTVLFGPERSVVAATNFIFFGVALLFVFDTIRRIFDKNLAYIAAGLFLASGALYLDSGGLQDLRWDLVGLVSFGIFILMFWRLALEPCRQTLLMTLVAFAATICTRFVTGVYGLVMISAIAAGCILLFLATRSPLWRRRMIWSILCGVAMAVIFCVYVAVFYRDISVYYLAHLQTGEREMRFAEAGVSGYLGLLLFYAGSAWAQFKYCIILSLLTMAGFAGVILIGGRAARARIAAGVRVNNDTILSLLVVVTACASVLLSLFIYSPSPVVIGVLTAPVVILLSVLLALFHTPIRERRGVALVSLSVFLIGAATFIYREVAEHPWTVDQLASARAHNELYRKIYEDHAQSGGRIAWFTMTDGTIEPVFNVFLYEAGLPDKVSQFKHNRFTVMALDATTILRELEMADAVVVWRDFAGRVDYPYPIIQSLQQHEATWRPVLAHEFVRRYGLEAGNGEIDYYTRPTTVETVVAPNGMEHFSDNLGNHPRFWLDERPAVITVRTLTDAPVRTTFEAEILPGPSFGDTTTRTLRVVAPGTDQQVVVSDASGWHLAVPVTLAPGLTEIQISAIAPAAPRLAVPGDSRLMIADVRHPRLH